MRRTSGARSHCGIVADSSSSVIHSGRSIERAIMSGSAELRAATRKPRANRRVALAVLLGGGAALAPVLTLGVATNHYGYGFAAVSALCVAAAWRWASRPGRAAIARSIEARQK